MGEGPDIDKRVRDVETAWKVHEAVCAERYKGITLRLNVTMGLLGLLLTAVVGGNPVLAALARMVGAH